MRSESPRCAWCRLPIEFCDGRFTDWMHSLTRRERCADGTNWAEPETAQQMTDRQNTRRNTRTAPAQTRRTA